MSGELLKLAAKRFYEEAINQGDLSVIDELVDPDYLEHEELPGVPQNREAVKAWVTMVRNAVPDVCATIEACVVEGDELWVHYALKGTQQGEFMGIPATGKCIDISGFDRVRFRDGKAIEHWGVGDSLKMLQQLGQVPA